MKVVKKLWGITLVRFCFVGGASALVGFILLRLFVEGASIEKNVSYFIQGLLVLQVNFYLHNVITWPDSAGLKGSLVAKWIKFHITKIGYVVFAQSMYFVLTFIGVDYQVAYIIDGALAAIYNYVTDSRLVYAKTRFG